MAIDMSAPPRLPAWLLSAIIGADDHDAIVGDLWEEHALRAQVARDDAAHWFWSQTIRSVPSLLKRRAHRSRWLSTMAIATAAYLMVGTLNAIGMVLAERVLSAAPAPHPRMAVIGLTAIAIGAHLAARVRTAAGYLLGVLVVAVAVVLQLFALDSSPVWYRLTFLVVGPMAAYAGAKVAGRRASFGAR
jgi:hypothetical protein